MARLLQWTLCTTESSKMFATTGLDELAQSIAILQNQVDSLALVAIQNHREPSLLGAAKEGCLFLIGECNCLAKQSETVRGNSTKAS